MNDMKLTSDGLFLLEKVVRSCVPTPTNGGMESREYLFSLVEKGLDVSVEDFKRSFPRKKCPTGLYDLYDHIFEFASRKEVSLIDFMLIMEFFSGEEHIKKAWEDIEDEKIVEILGIDYATRDYVSHVMMPVRIIDIKDGLFSVEYANDNVSFKSFDMVAFPEEQRKMHIGQWVLAHYASLLIADLDDQQVQFMLNLQKKSDNFMNACMSLKEKGIEHKKMLHFAWAKKLVNSCRI